MKMVAKNSSGKSTRNIILVIFALIQIVLIGVIYSPRFLPNNNESGTLLGDIKTSEIIGLKISDGEQQVSLAKDGDEWILPEADNFPVELDKVTPFLDKLIALDNQSLVADNKTSHKRLEVASDNFVRKIDVELKGNKNTTLYVGSSPTASATHLRVSNQDSVYLNRDFRSHDANAETSNWIEAAYFEIEQDNAIRLRLQNEQGDLTFRKVKNNWRLINSTEDENVELDESAIDSLLRKASTIRMVRPLGKEAKEEYGLDNPKATVTIVTLKELEEEESTEEGESESEAEESEEDESESEAEESEEPKSERQTYTLTVGNELDDGFVIKFSESEYYVVVSDFNASDFVEQSKEDFIVVEETEEVSDEDLEESALESETDEDSVEGEGELPNEEDLEEDILESEVDEESSTSEINEEVANEEESEDTLEPEVVAEEISDEEVPEDEGTLEVEEVEVSENDPSNEISDEEISEEEPVGSEISEEEAPVTSEEGVSNE